MRKDDWSLNSGTESLSFFGKDNRSSKYMLVQYMRDSWRHEPRNIGIVVWSKDSIVAKFRGESGDNLGKLEILPSFIDNKNMYKYWIESWRNLISKDEIIPLRGGSPVHKENPLFLSILFQFSNESFFFVEGGYLEDMESADEACNYLFDILVLESEETAALEPSKERVDWTCSRIFENTGIKKNPNFKKDYAVRSNDEYLTFSYAFEAIGGATLFEIVPFPSQGSEITRSAQSAAWKYEHINEVIPFQSRISLVHVSSNRLERDIIKRSLSLLRNRSRVINLSYDSHKAEMTNLMRMFAKDEKKLELTLSI